MSEYRDWQVGDRVVCVQASEPITGGKGVCWGEGEAIEEGRVYTIKRIYINFGKPHVWLHEVERCAGARLAYGPDVGYGAERFRKVQPRKTSIEVFERILLNPTIPVKEEA